MAKTSVTMWDTNPANNTDVGGININTGTNVAVIDNALREIMAQVAGAGFARTGAANTFNADQTVRSTNDSNSVGPDLMLLRDSATPAIGDFLGRFRFQGKNTAGSILAYADIQGYMDDPTSGTESGRIVFRTMRSGSNSPIRAFIGAGLYMANANGADMGTGTINATAVYDDGSLLCAPIEEAVTGAYNGAAWAELAPHGGLKRYEEMKRRGFRPGSANDYADEIDRHQGIPGYWNRAEWEVRTGRRPDPVKRDEILQTKTVRERSRLLAEFDANPPVKSGTEARVSIAERLEMALLALDYAALAIRDLTKRVQALEAKK